MSNATHTISPKKRESTIVRTSILGILANVFLAGFKATIGIWSNSIAVILDAVNNLSDAISSVITIARTKLSNKQADYSHPFGHGRLEYMTTTVIAAVIMYAGISSLVESIKGILDPQTPDYSPTALIIIAVAVLIKIILGNYVQSVGKRVNSDTLAASGADALFDAILSSSVLAAALIYTYTGVSLEAYVGVLISVFIIKASVEMLSDSVKEIIGKRADPALAAHIAEIVNKDPDANGVYDLILNNYGPDRYVGSFHTEVSDQSTATDIDNMMRRLSTNIYEETSGKVIVAAISIYAENRTDNRILKMRNTVTKIALTHEGVLQVHGFIANLDEKTIAFDAVIEFGYDGNAIVDDIKKKLSKIYPDMNITILIDRNTSDLSKYEAGRDLH